MNQKKQSMVMIITFFIVILLLLSGCIDNRAPVPDETDLSSFSRSDLLFIQQQLMDWFECHLNKNTGLLTDMRENTSLIQDLLTGFVLATFSSMNTTFPGVLQQNINSIVRIYDDHPDGFNLTTTSLLLSLIYETPESTSNPVLEQALADHILSFRATNTQFNTTPILSDEAAYGLTALRTHVQKTNNQSIQKNTTLLLEYYQQLLNEPSYYSPWYTPVFSQIDSSFNLPVNPYQTITQINTVLVENQETNDLLTTGNYIPPDQSYDLTFHIQSLNSMMYAVNRSDNLNDTKNQTHFHQSLILGLMHLKNIMLNEKTNLSIKQNLTLLPILYELNSVLPNTNYSYVWEPETQTLIEAKTLQTSNELWMVLAIGVMASIGLLSLVFIIIRLYYRNKKS